VRTHLGRVVRMGVQERDDFPTPLRGGGPYDLFLGLRNLKAAVQPRVIGELQDPLPADVVHGA